MLIHGGYYFKIITYGSRIEGHDAAAKPFNNTPQYRFKHKSRKVFKKSKSSAHGTVLTQTQFSCTISHTQLILKCSKALHRCVHNPKAHRHFRDCGLILKLKTYSRVLQKCPGSRSFCKCTWCLERRVALSCSPGFAGAHVWAFHHQRKSLQCWAGHGWVRDHTGHSKHAHWTRQTRPLVWIHRGWDHPSKGGGVHQVSGPLEDG